MGHNTREKLSSVAVSGGFNLIIIPNKKILALQVELGELAQNWRGFKFWSEDQESNTEYVCELCEGRKEISALTDTGSVGETYEVYDVYEVDVACPLCEGYDNDENPMLIEYVDCLHFILSIGLDIGVKSFKPKKLISFTNNITGQFNAVFKLIGAWDKVMLLIDHNLYYVLVNNFLNLGEMLGFTWEQIEQAYIDKNKINHERQENKY